MRLTGKVVIVTGAARGIGKATAAAFLRAGASVAVVDLDRGEDQPLLRELGGAGPRLRFWQVDVSDPDETRRMAREVSGTFGHIDILVNNAGIVRDAQVLKMDPQDFDMVLATNLKGTFNCTQAVVPYMVEQEGGRILNAASVVALYGNFGQTNYVAAKAGVIGMTRVWARELGPLGILVNAVAPGFIATRMVEGIPEKVKVELTGRVPLGRFGRPEEVASVYLFLASDEASYINGAVISVDGGGVF